MPIIDAVHGIEWRGVRDADRRGWRAQWHPTRALKAFPAFSFMSLPELFPTEQDALQFVKENVEAILSGRR